MALVSAADRRPLACGHYFVYSGGNPTIVTSCKMCLLLNYFTLQANENEHYDDGCCDWKDLH
jgi:hypothetical protein